ncbi:hypothetical protein HDU76_004021, partial [Blyttiomyces sp. JEL0837]
MQSLQQEGVSMFKTVDELLEAVIQRETAMKADPRFAATTKATAAIASTSANGDNKNTFNMTPRHCDIHGDCFYDNKHCRLQKKGKGKMGIKDGKVAKKKFEKKNGGKPRGAAAKASTDTETKEDNTTEVSVTESVVIDAVVSAIKKNACANAAHTLSVVIPASSSSSTSLASPVVDSPVPLTPLGAYDFPVNDHDDELYDESLDDMMEDVQLDESSESSEYKSTLNYFC